LIHNHHSSLLAFESQLPKVSFLFLVWCVNSLCPCAESWTSTKKKFTKYSPMGSFWHAQESWMGNWSFTANQKVIHNPSCSSSWLPTLIWI
jgi:hypothetical protein